MSLDATLACDEVSPSRRVAAAASDAARPAPGATVRVSIGPTANEAVTVWVAGELDMASAPLLDDALQTAHATRSPHIRVDLSAVSFCDCAGLRPLVAGDRQLRAAGARLTLVRPSGPVRWLLQLAKMDRILTLDRHAGAAAC